MRSSILFCILLTITLVTSFPSTFDTRIQPSSFYTSHVTDSQQICEVYTWSLRLAQIVSNSYSIQMKKQIRLSAQQIVDCLNQTSNDICQEATLDNIKNAINNVNKFGLTEQRCYKNKLLQSIGTRRCKQKCEDGTAFTLRIIPEIHEEIGIDQVYSKLGTGGYAAFAIVKVYDQMKYYSSENEKNLVTSGEMYGYTIGEIVGWKKRGGTVTINLGGPGWGFKGYANLPATNQFIVKVYSVYFDKYKSSDTDFLSAMQ